eukprot:TRINITY_DN6905_c1_g2_i3.p1 TRINITY_DN6905_c1_g2~~TRINITY_DN6905_c1_g2_i3.p1  ORF type:complete len:149 (-),score=7.66 TRINITY_DN6905_c1_g2_i3:233-679(-)
MRIQRTQITKLTSQPCIPVSFIVFCCWIFFFLFFLTLLFFHAFVAGSLTKWSGQCFIPENSDDLLRVRISMFNGLSGSPVLVDSLNGPLVIGVVQGHQEAPIEENVAVYVDQPSVRAGLQRIRAQFTRYERHVAVVRNILDVQNNDEL